MQGLNNLGCLGKLDHKLFEVLKIWMKLKEWQILNPDDNNYFFNANFFYNEIVNHSSPAVVAWR